MNKLIVLLLTLLCSVTSLSQDWKALGPFYGKSTKEPYLHSMGLVDAVLAHPNDINTFLMATNSSGIWKTRDRGVTWKCVTENKKFIPGMGVKSFAANPKNPNEIVAAAGNYVYGYDSYQGGLMVSNDWGDTWELSASFKEVIKDDAVFKVTYSKEGALYVLSGKKLFISQDNGSTFIPIFEIDDKKSYISSNAQYLVDFEVSETGIVFVSSGHQWGSRANCWRSTDGGESWENLEELPEFNEVKKRSFLSAKMTPFSEGKIIIGYCDGKNIVLYKSKDNGNSFNKTGNIKLNYETGDAKPSKFEMEFSTEYPDRVYMGFVEFFKWDSINGMKKLSPTSNISSEDHDDVRALQIIKEKGVEKVLMGNDGGVTIYNPKENKFEGLNGYNLPTLQVYNMAVSQFDSNFSIYIGTQDNGTFAYRNEDWNFIGGGDGGGNYLSDDAAVNMYSVNHILVVYQGKTKRYLSPNKQFTSWYIDFPVEVSKKDSLVLMGSSRRGEKNNARLFIQDLGQRDHKGVEVPGMQKIGEIAVDNQNQDIIYVAEGDHLDNKKDKPKFMKTVNRGKSFIDMTDAEVYPDPYHTFEGRSRDTVTLRKILGYRNITDIEIDPYNSNVLYVSLSGYFTQMSWSKSWEYYSVLKSEDGGETWEDYSYGLPVTPIHCLLRDERDEGILFCGGDEGIFIKHRYDENWKVYGNKFPKNLAVTDLKINYCQDNIYCATYGRGVFTADLYTISDYTEITTDTKIDSYQFIKRDIEVQKGVTLTITADILMGPNTEITLHPKSKLIVDGGSISRSCDYEWLGVNIKEKRFLWIFKRKRGEVILKNGGTINK